LPASIGLISGLKIGFVLATSVSVMTPSTLLTIVIFLTRPDSALSAVIRPNATLFGVTWTGCQIVPLIVTDVVAVLGTFVDTVIRLVSWPPRFFVEILIGILPVSPG